MIEYLKMVPEDYDKLESLCREYLDNGSMLHDRIIEVFNDSSTISLKAVDTDTGEIVAIMIYTKGIAFSCDNEYVIKKVTDYVGDTDVYTGEAFLVKPEYRKSGIAYDMQQKMKDYLEEKKAKTGRETVLLHEMWVYPDGKIPAYRSAKEIYGISEDLGIIEHFYKDYYKQGHLCPICGKNCVCSARITLSRI